MKLSKERQQLVENILERKFSELCPQHQDELEEIKRFNQTSGEFKTRINKKHGEHMQKIANLMVEAYLEAYQAEDQIPNDNDIPEIINRISVRLSKETSDSALRLPVFSGLSSEMEGILSRIKRNADLDLRNAKKEAELKTKKDQEKRMNEQSVIERQNARNRVLKRIYEESGGSPLKGVRYDVIKDKEQMTIEEVQSICTYLSQNGLLRPSRPHKCFITGEGINKIETEILPQKKSDSTNPVLKKRV